MTSKEFKIWLDGILTPLNLEEVEVRNEFGSNYNHLTMLKTIYNKLNEVREINNLESKTETTLLTEIFKHTPPPNPFDIKCEIKKEQ